MFSLVNNFVEWASSCLLDSEEGISYLTNRGSSKDQWMKHSIGFVGGDYDPDPSLDPSHNHNCSEIDKKHLWCDTCRFRYWSTLREEDEDGRKTQTVGRRILNSVVYPLTSYSGSLVGFQTRSIREKSFDTFLCTRRPEGFFFGTASSVHNIWTTGEVILVEGPSDQLIMERFLNTNVLAITTNSPNINQYKFLLRFTKRVYLCLDLDKAGREGTKNIINKYGSKLDLIDVQYGHQLHRAKDPNDLWKILGDDKFKKHLEKSFKS